MTPCHLHHHGGKQEPTRKPACCWGCHADYFTLGVTERNENTKTLEKEEEGALDQSYGEVKSCRDREDPAESPSALSLLGALLAGASPTPSLGPVQAPGLDTKIFLFKRITNYCLIR